MAFIIPEKIERLTHGGVVKALLEENKDYAVPSRTNWSKHVPDLVHRTKKITVEVELSDLDKAWGQCLSYYRLGSEKIHLLLTPKLYAQYETDERSYVVRNPIPNISLHKLPVVKKRRGRPPQKIVMREATISHPEEKFYEPPDTKKQPSSLNPWKTPDKAPFLKTSRSWQRTNKTTPTPPKLKPLSKERRGRPRAIQRFKPNSADPCEYCHIFASNPVFEHTLCCGRALHASPENSVYKSSNDKDAKKKPKTHKWDHNKETGLSTCKRCGIKVKAYRVKRGGIAPCNPELIKRFCDHKWGKWFIPFAKGEKEMRLCHICKLKEERSISLREGK